MLYSRFAGRYPLSASRVGNGRYGHHLKMSVESRTYRIGSAPFRSLKGQRSSSRSTGKGAFPNEFFEYLHAEPLVIRTYLRSISEVPACCFLRPQKAFFFKAQRSFWLKNHGAFRTSNVSFPQPHFGDVKMPALWATQRARKNHRIERRLYEEARRLCP